MAHWLICISTQQEIANLLPARLLSVDKVYALATEHARAQGWPQQLERALERSQTPLEVVALSDEQARGPVALRRRVEALLEAKAAGDVITFAWAGGQKVQSVGLWLAYEALVAREPDRAHAAVYVDAQRGVGMCWGQPDECEELSMQVELTLDEVLDVRALKRTLRGRGQLLWPGPTPWQPWQLEACRLFAQSQEFRRLCFESATPAEEGSRELEQCLSVEGVRQSMERALELIPSAWVSEQDQLRKPWSTLRARLTQEVSDRLRRLIIEQLRRAPAELSLKVEPPRSPQVRAYMASIQLGPISWRAGQYKIGQGEQARFSTLFELLLMERVQRWAMAYPELVAQVWANVEVCRHGHDEVLAEFDVVILDRVGRVVVLDAKSFKQDNQGARAQTYASQQLGGSFGQRYAVYPMFKEDIGAPTTALPSHQWGAQPWYPKALTNQSAHWRDGTSQRAAMQLIPFDESDALERRLTALCQ